MTATMLKLKPQWIIFWALLMFQSVAAQHSGFNRNDEGWTVVGDAQGPSIIPYHDSVGGNPGGYCYAVDDVTGDFWYWSAPDTFLGNKSASFGKYLRFDLKQSKLINQANRADVILEGSGVKIYYNTPYNPDTAWTHYDVLLDTVNWEKSSYGSGQFVSRDGLKQVLSSLTKLWIRGEYIVGPDIGSIDNVILEPLSSAVTSLTTGPASLEVFPNPATDQFTLQLKGAPQPSVQVGLFSSAGQRLYQEVLDFQSGVVQKTISCRDFPAGIYWVRVSDGSGSGFRELVIE